MEIEKYGLRCVDVNEYVGKIVEVVKKYGGERMVFYSSFHPDAVIQTRHEVYFLTEAGRFKIDDDRCNSYEAALGMCIEHGLAGIVSDVVPLMENLVVIERFHEQGLKVMSFGAGNCIPNTIKAQVDANIDGIISDEILTVRRVLELRE